MKRLVLIILCIGFIISATCIAACGDKNEYVPKGEFYVKTSPANGDAGVKEVLDLEAEYKSYQGAGDITVPVTVGFGHQPDTVGLYGEGANDTFYVLYQVFEYPLKDNPQPVWENQVEYSDSFYGAKYNSTVPKNRSFLFIPVYGDFYPLYKEGAEIVFPEGVQSGLVRVNFYIVLENDNEQTVSEGLEFSFTRKDGVLALD